MKKIKFKNSILLIALLIIYFFFISIGIRLFVRQVLVKSLNIDNAFTQFIFSDSEAMNKVEIDNTEEKIKIDWASIYPFEITELKRVSDGFLNKYSYRINDAINRVEVYCTDLLFYYNKIVELNYKILNIINFDFKTDKLLNETYFMENGYLTSKFRKLNVDEINSISESVIDFNKFLMSKEIPLIYVDAGSKVCPWDKQLSKDSIVYTNENGNDLLKMLNNSGINTIDMREEMKLANVDWYNCYYRTDHHWKTEMGLFSANVISKKLNNYGFNYKDNYFDVNNYNVNTEKNYFLGSRGRAVTFENASLENFDIITPKEYTNFNVIIPTKEIDIKGSFNDTLIDLKSFNNIRYYTKKDYLEKEDAYGALSIAKNDAVSQIINLDDCNNKNKKILMICDSFAWYTRMFLSCDTGEIDSIYPKTFDGSIKSYINSTNPDVVIIMYFEENIMPIDFSNHNSLFDFR